MAGPYTAVRYALTKRVIHQHAYVSLTNQPHEAFGIDLESHVVENRYFSYPPMP